MFERFTKPARAVVQQADRHRRATTASEIRPEHLLMALLDQDGGLDADDAEALAAIGIDLDEVVRRIDDNLGGLSAQPSRRGRFSRGGRKVIELALREALALRHSYIGTEHLLLALARTDARVVADTFAACGLEQSRLRPAVAEAVRKAG